MAYACGTWDAVPPNEALRLWLKVQLQQKPCESLHCGCQPLQGLTNLHPHAVRVTSTRAYKQLKMSTQVNTGHIHAQEAMNNGAHWMFLPAESLKKPQVGFAEFAPSAQVTPVWPPVLMSACQEPDTGQSLLDEAFMGEWLSIWQRQPDIGALQGCNRMAGGCKSRSAECSLECAGRCTLCISPRCVRYQTA